MSAILFYTFANNPVTTSMCCYCCYKKVESDSAKLVQKGKVKANELKENIKKLRNPQAPQPIQTMMPTLHPARGII